MSSGNTSDSQSSSMNEASASVIIYISYPGTCTMYTCISCFSITVQVNIGLMARFYQLLYASDVCHWLLMLFGDWYRPLSQSISWISLLDMTAVVFWPQVSSICCVLCNICLFLLPSLLSTIHQGKGTEACSWDSVCWLSYKVRYQQSIWWTFCLSNSLSYSHINSGFANFIWYWYWSVRFLQTQGL